MTKLDRTIKISKFLTNLPYNKFNLDNYFPILYKSFGELGFKNTDANLPIKLMSGQHVNSGIITSNNLIAPYRKRNIYIIGKGLLFDAGGYNLKREMAGMNKDMAGMAIALAIAELSPKVIAVCPVTTNFIHNNQILPSDIISIGKKQVEVTNTDAEGRLVLAEAISTLNVSKSDIIITIATLTGACEYAIDKKATGVLTPSDKLASLYLDASKEEKEYAWRLPLWDYLQKKHYNKKLIQNAIKDIKAGTTEGAMFIQQFIPYPENWIHLDIASSAFDDKGKANGVPIKSLLNFIRRL